MTPSRDPADLEARFRSAEGAATRSDGEPGRVARVTGAAGSDLVALVLAGLTGYALALALHARRRRPDDT